MINLLDRKRTSKGNIYKFEIDSASDITDLPTTTEETDEFTKAIMGSTAFCIAEGLTYILNSSDEWIKQDSYIEY